MSNGQQCCLVGVCCPPGSVAQRQAWVELIRHERPQMTDTEIQAAADRVLGGFTNFADVVGFIDQPDKPAA